MATMKPKLFRRERPAVDLGDIDTSPAVPPEIVSAQIRRPPQVELKRTHGDEQYDIGSAENIPRRGDRISPLTQELRNSARSAARERMMLGGGNGQSNPTPIFQQMATQNDTVAVEFQSRQRESGAWAGGPGPSAFVPNPFDERIRELQGQSPVPSRLDHTPSVAGRPAASLRPIVPEDVDRLWDWIRQEPDMARDFFGQAPRTALDLHLLFREYVKADGTGTAVARAITLNGEHMGFALLYPIHQEMRVAVAHLYLAPQVRGHLETWLPWLLQQAEQQVPQGIRIAVYDRSGWSPILTRYGFTPHTLLIKER